MTQPPHVRIIAIPPGEAPLWVREKWVGLELPLADGKNAAQEVFTSGVLSGSRNRFLAIIWGMLGRLKVQSGYPVYVNDALGVLEQTAPDAAIWWRDNIRRLQQPKRKFLFASAVCQVIDTTSVGDATRKLVPNDAARTQTSSTVPHISMPS
jgi:hypothetical protein